MANTFKNGTIDGLSGSYTDYVVCPNNTGDTCVVLSIYFSNTGGSDRTFGCRITDSGGTSQVTLADGMQISPESAIELCPNKFVLTQGQKIQANSNSSDVKLIISYMENT